MICCSNQVSESDHAVVVAKPQHQCNKKAFFSGIYLQPPVIQKENDSKHSIMHWNHTWNIVSCEKCLRV